MVARRLREANVFTRTVQLKLRYSDFTTITRAHTLSTATQLDTEILSPIRTLWKKNWKRGQTVRLLGVQASGLETGEGQLGLIEADKHERWKSALTAADKLRDKFGERTIVLGTSVKREIREKVHENPADLHGKKGQKPKADSSSR